MATVSDELILPIGSVFQGGYEILSRLGGGRFGWVYKARQLSTGQHVAIKILRFLQKDTRADIENQNARFRREMRLCAGMSHPSIVRLIDSGEANDGVLYAVFEYAQGATLREVLTTEGKLAVREALHLMSEVLDALACAHAHGVVHRDLKPDNVMVTKTGARRHALILDFGLGGFTRDAEEWALPRLTATHEILGTPCYAAPEQLRGEPPSARSDLYSWGLMFLECLTGELAVNGASGIDVIRKQLGPEPIPIPAWLRKQGLGRLLDIVTAKQVEKRDVTIPGLLEALSTIELGEFPSTVEPGEPEELPEGQRRQLTVVSCRLTVAPVGRRALDPEEVDETLHAQHALYGEIAARAGGQIAGVLADRIVLVFGYPRAREDDARRAARTSLVIVAEATRAAGRLATERRIRLEVRIGVHTGVVVVRDLRQATYQGLYDLVGLTPQLAVRLDEQAAAGDILVSGDTQRLMRGELGAEPAGELRTGDDTGSVPIFRLTSEHKRAGLETIPWARQAPLVGRSAQLRQLLGSWEAAQKGEPSVVLLSGEPGIGKSRLVRELRRNVAPDAWREGRCVEENQASPLRPMVDLLLGTRESVAAMLGHHGFDVAETLPLFADFFPAPADARPAPPQFTPERQKELLLQAIITLVLRMAQERPLVLALEDLHWADPTTLELLVLLIGELRAAGAMVSDRPPRVTLVFTARPEFSPPWSVEDVAVIPLARLPKHDVVELVAAGLATGRALPAALLDKVVQHSDGVPLFVEEVTRVLLDAGALADSLNERAIDDLALEIPATLRELLTARLDPLSPSARDTIQLAAVLGREFRYEVLSAVERKDESFLRDCLRELLDAGLLFARRSARSEGYVFKHALVRDTAYESMTRPRRQRLHALVAGTLRQRFPDVEQTQPELLALHFERGGDEATAAEYWYRAGEAALKRAAYTEAQQLLERGLGLLERMPESSERNHREVALLTLLGTVFFSTRGNAAEEVERTFARARQLCEQLGEDVPLRVLNGMMTVPLARGDRAATSQLLPHFERLAATDDPVTSIAGHAILGVYSFWSGEFQLAREHAAVGTKLYGTAEFQRFAAEYGWDGGLFCHAYEMTSLFNLGYPDRAEAVRREMVTLAEKSGNPYSILLALGFGATLSYDRGETDATLETSDRVIALSTEQRLYPWLAGGHCGRGAALLDRGELPEAMAEITLGLGLYQGMGVLMSYGYYLTYLAAAHRDAGNIDDGLATVQEGLALCETLFTRFHESELLRLKGELLARRGDEGDAEASLRAAIELARKRGGKSLELRAATSLGRLLHERGRRDEARQLVGDVYGWFTEGFDTRDLRTAHALLAQLD